MRNHKIQLFLLLCSVSNILIFHRVSLRCSFIDIFEEDERQQRNPRQNAVVRLATFDTDTFDAYTIDFTKLNHFIRRMHFPVMWMYIFPRHLLFFFKHLFDILLYSGNYLKFSSNHNMKLLNPFAVKSFYVSTRIFPN